MKQCNSAHGDKLCSPDISSPTWKRGQVTTEGQGSLRAENSKTGSARDPAPTGRKGRGTYRDSLMHNLSGSELCRVRSIKTVFFVLEPAVDINLSQEEEEFWFREGRVSPRTKRNQNQKRDKPGWAETRKEVTVR